MNRVMPEPQSHRGPAAARSASSEPVRLPIHFFAIAVFSFALGTATAPWAVVNLADYFYQLPVLAWVHTFTLGWMTSAIFGVTYRYVPAMTNRQIRYPRLATAQLVLYLLGASGVVAHFMLGSWDGVWMAGVVVAVSVILFAINLVPCMAPNFGRGAAETGLLMALFFLLCAVCLGAVLAFDKERSFMPGTLLRNLSAHAHLAALGWVTMAICAVSYRLFMTAMITPTAPVPRVPRAAMVQILGLAAATVALFVALIAGLANLTVWTVAVAAALAAYLMIFERILRRRSAAVWMVRHALAGALCLLLAVVSGTYLTIVGVGSPFGARLACAYGILGLLGWASNLIIGMSYQFFAGFVARVRLVLGWPTLGVPELSVNSGQGLVFWAFNTGVLIMAAGLLMGRVAVAQAGAFSLALSGLVYSAAMAWTLSFAYRRGAARTTDRVLRAAPDLRK